MILFKYKSMLLSIVILALIITTPSALADGHKEANNQHHDEKVITINDDIVSESGIKTSIAGAGNIHQQLITYGKIVTDPSHISHIRARFAGTVTDVQVNIGQPVKKGDILATIEANQSLSSYRIRAPFDGIITARHANPGELAQDQPLFTVADYSFMWAELKIFPQDMASVKAGQKVTLVINDREILSTIDHVLPNDNDHPFILARVSIDNPKNQLSAGMMAEGHITINRRPADIVVNKTAIQELENESVVFVKTSQGFETRKVTLGDDDGTNTEIINGLNKGERYVSDNSYILKADLLKSGAEHAH